MEDKGLAELDREDFVAEAYVEKLIETAELKELLRAENELVTGLFLPPLFQESFLGEADDVRGYRDTGV